MNTLLSQLRGLPTTNLIIYLLGALAVMMSMLYLHAIKPAYIQSQELHSDHQRLVRLTQKFNLNELRASIEKTKDQQHLVRDSMLQNIPDRELENALPGILETLHRVAKSHGLRTQKLQPGEITRNSEIATVPVSMLVMGPYQHMYNWINNFTTEIDGVSVSDIQATKSPDSNGDRTLTINLVIYGR